LYSSHNSIIALGRHIGIELRLVLQLQLVECFFEVLVIDADDDVAEHVDQTAVRVIREPLVAGGVGQADDRLVVQTEVQNGVHHAGHRSRGARANGDQQRILQIAELLAEFLLERRHCLLDIVHQGFGELLAVFVVQSAALGRDRESRRHRQADAGHFRQICPFTAQQLLLAAISLAACLAKVIGQLAARRSRSFLRHA
jgi:hypothetical protein